MSFTTIAVTMKYENADGSVPTGEVVFLLSSVLQQAGTTDELVVPQTQVATLDGTGAASINLIANDDPATEPVGSYYTVTERIAGAPKRTYQVIVPHTAPGGTIDLSALAPATGTPAYTLALGGDLAGTPAAATVIGLQGRSVDSTAPTDGYVLTWHAATSKWMPLASAGGGSLPSGTSAGQVLGWNGTTWGAETVSGDVALASGGAATVGGLQGRAVASTAPTDGYVLTWVAATSKWTPMAASGGGGGAPSGPAGGVLTGTYPNPGADATKIVVTSDQRNYFAPPPSGDTTGATDTTALANIAALASASNPIVCILNPQATASAPYYVTSLPQVTPYFSIWSPFAITYIMDVGAGGSSCLVISARNNVGATLDLIGGQLGGFVLDGTNHTAGTGARVGVEIGDTIAGVKNNHRITVRHYNQGTAHTAGSDIGVWLVNKTTNSETEHNELNFAVNDCTTCYKFDIAGGNSSFDYSIYNFWLYCNPNQDGFVFTNGVQLIGARLNFRGNFATGTTNTGVALRFGSDNTPVTIDGDCDIHFETDGSTGVGHAAYHFGNSASVRLGGQFEEITGNSVPFTAGNLALGQTQWQFSGRMRGNDLDAILCASATKTAFHYFGGAATSSRGHAVFSGSNLQIDCASGDIFQGTLLNGANTLVLQNVDHNRARSILLRLNQPASGAAGTLSLSALGNNAQGTAMAAVFIDASTGPVLSAVNGQTDMLRLTTLDGVTWYVTSESTSTALTGSAGGVLGGSYPNPTFAAPPAGSAGTVPAVGATAGPPTSGTWAVGSIWVDANAVLWECTAAGTPGTWQVCLGQDFQKRYGMPTGAHGETINMPVGNPTAALATGSLYGARIALPAGVAISHLNAYFAAAGTIGTGNWWMALLDSSYNILATSANQTSAPPTGTNTNLAVATTWGGSSYGAASSFTTTYAGVYYLAVIVNGFTANPSLYGGSASPGPYAGTAPFMAIAPTLANVSNLGAGSTPPSGASQATATVSGTNGPTWYGWC